jgi:hypothetical protein
MRFHKVSRGILECTADGITYRATHYPSGGRGTRSYWVVQTSDRPQAEYERNGNDWYEPSEARVRESIAAVINQRRSQR